jgi:hypothetical protein
MSNERIAELVTILAPRSFWNMNSRCHGVDVALTGMLFKSKNGIDGDSSFPIAEATFRRGKRHCDEYKGAFNGARPAVQVPGNAH